MTSPCEHCASIFTNENTFWASSNINNDDPVLYERKRSSLADTAANGCLLCVLLQRHYIKVQRSLPLSTGQISRRSIDGQKSIEDLLFSFRVQKSGGGMSLPRHMRVTVPDIVFGGEMVLGMAADAENILSAHITAIKKATSRDAKASSSLTRSWIADCNRNHEGCGDYSGPGPPMPTRLIDVTNVPDSLRLVESNKLQGFYATLSYCWGKSKPFISTRQNLSQLQAGFALSNLPQTLQDACLTTRDLGLRYIWIDALCIVQDSAEDMEAEMASMEQIFQNSYITIAAACVSDSGESFRKVQDAHSGIVKLPAYCYDRLDNGSEQLRTNGQVQLWHKDSVSFGREPLHERAWTLQEVFLAPRLLVYSRTCRLFKCPSGYQSDDPSTDWDSYCARAGVNPTRPKHQETPLRRPTLSSISPGITSIIGSTSTQANRLPEQYRAWKRIVRDYSSRHLTIPGDKLPAIAGLAKSFQKDNNDEYLAGLWRSHLPRELSWNMRNATRPSLYRAPSWSWMSLDGTLSWAADDCGHFALEADILGCRTTPVIPSAPLSRVLAGELIIRGYLRPNVPDLQLRLPFARPNDHLLEGSFGEIWRDADGEDPVFEDEQEYSTNSVAHESTEVEQPILASSSPSEHGIYWLLLLARCYSPNEPRDRRESETGLPEDDNAVWGMALSRRGGDVFRRVGYFRGGEGCLRWFHREETKTIRIV